MIMTVQVIKGEGTTPAQQQYLAARRLLKQYGSLAVVLAILAGEHKAKNRDHVRGVRGVLQRMADAYRWFRTFPGVSAHHALVLAWAEQWARAFDVDAYYTPDAAAEMDGEYGAVVWCVTMPKYDRDESDVVFTLGGCDEPMTDRDTRFEKASRYADALSLWVGE